MYLKIENESLEDRGDAQQYLREIISQIGLGYSKGPGWDLLDGEYVLDTDTQDKGGETLTPEQTAELASQIQQPGPTEPQTTEAAPEGGAPQGGDDKGFRFPWEKGNANTTTPPTIA